MQAKVKDTYRFGPSLLAFSRTEFIKGEWRTVPAGVEAQAEAHEWLDVREDPKPDEVEAQEIPTADAVLTEILEGETPTADAKLAEMISELDAEEAEESPSEEVEPEPEEAPKKRGRGKNK